MKLTMNDIIRKLTSRKLWIALAGITTGLAMVFGVEGGEITDVAGAVTAIASAITYIIAEATVDKASAGKVAEKSVSVEISEKSVDE